MKSMAAETKPEVPAYKPGDEGYNRISGRKTLRLVAVLISAILILCILSVYLIIKG